MNDTHACPHPLCSRRVGDEQFACRSHWFQLPKYLRDAIWVTYLADDFQGHVDAMDDARRWYREALS